MARVYRAALVGCSRMGAFIDNEVIGRNPSIVLPYSHAAGYKACARTELVAGADLRPDVLAAFGERYGVAPEHHYTDYREMIEREQPDILSIATQPEDRTEIALFAIAHGVRALYCEKPLCASLAEAEELRAACREHHVVFNMGTNRRWHPGFDAMLAAIQRGEIGPLRTLVIYATGALFNTASHFFDLMLRLNSDVPPQWVQAHLPRGDELIVDGEVRDDPAGEGIIAFANGVKAHALLSPRGVEFEAIGEQAAISALNNGMEFRVRRRTATGERWWEDAPPLTFTQASSTLRLIEDLVEALDTGGPTRGGIEVAYQNMQIIFGFIESHRQGGRRIALPLTNHDLRFRRPGRAPRQRKLAPS